MSEQIYGKYAKFIPGKFSNNWKNQYEVPIKNNYDKQIGLVIFDENFQDGDLLPGPDFPVEHRNLVINKARQYAINNIQKHYNYNKLDTLHVDFYRKIIHS